MAKRKVGDGGTPATVALAKAGIEFSLHPYEHDPGSTHFGDEAAAALGVDPRVIFKTLLASVQLARPTLVCAVVPVAAQLDLKALAAAVGAKKAEMAEPAVVERSSGYVVGGISPIGQRTGVTTLVDESARGLEVMLVSAGRRGLQIGIAPDDLCAATGARFAALAR